jgi:hypothetical protein
MEKKYIGVRYKYIWGNRRAYTVQFQHNNVLYSFGQYDTPKECAKAYDLFVIKNKIDRETNFFKKKVV